jgi:hypothetical protein
MNSENVIAERINEFLSRVYGTNVLCNKPNWRVIWLPDITIRVHETYEDITESGIYLGTKTGFREKPKYWYLQPCWGIEKLYIADSLAIKEDLSGEAYSYELMFPFLNGDDEQVPLREYPVQFFVHQYTHAEKRIRDIQGEMEKRDEVAVQRARDILYETPEEVALRYKEAVIVPSNYVKEDRVN